MLLILFEVHHSTISSAAHSEIIKSAQASINFIKNNEEAKAFSFQTSASAHSLNNSDNSKASDNYRHLAIQCKKRKTNFSPNTFVTTNCNF